MKLLAPLFALTSLALVACAADPAASGSAEAPLQTVRAGNDTPVADACPVAIPGPSKANNDGAWVRGTAHFDPSHFKAGAKPVLRVVLRHSFALVRGEEKIGGRLHGWKNIPIEDVASGTQTFAIDMAANHTMWSEGNGVFHVVLIIDEDGDNDLDHVTTQTEAIVAGHPGSNELTAIADVDISCHAPSPCLDVQVACTGESCLEITPVTSCEKRLPACADDGDFCH